MPFLLLMERLYLHFSILRMLGTSLLLSRIWGFQLLKHLIWSKYVSSSSSWFFQQVCISPTYLFLCLFSREEILLVLWIVSWQLNPMTNGNKPVELEFGNLVPTSSLLLHLGNHHFSENTLTHSSTLCREPHPSTLTILPLRLILTSWLASSTTLSNQIPFSFLKCKLFHVYVSLTLFVPLSSAHFRFLKHTCPRCSLR